MPYPTTSSLQSDLPNDYSSLSVSLAEGLSIHLFIHPPTLLLLAPPPFRLSAWRIGPLSPLCHEIFMEFLNLPNVFFYSGT
jgi:hypothetical protein